MQHHNCSNFTFGNDNCCSGNNSLFTFNLYEVLIEIVTIYFIHFQLIQFKSLNGQLFTSQSHTNIHLIQNLSNIHIFLVFETCNTLVCHKEAWFWVLIAHFFALAQHDYSFSLQNHKDSHLIQILSKCHILISTSKHFSFFNIFLTLYFLCLIPFQFFFHFDFEDHC